MAWVYREHATTPALFTLEEEARAAKRGLWAEAALVAPWEFRHRGRPAPAPAVVAENTPAGCGAKRYCREMHDCAEACFYFAQYGVVSLDGDGGGVSCEKVCGR